MVVVLRIRTFRDVSSSALLRLDSEQLEQTRNVDAEGHGSDHRARLDLAHDRKTMTHLRRVATVEREADRDVSRAELRRVEAESALDAGRAVRLRRTRHDAVGHSDELKRTRRGKLANDDCDRIPALASEPGRAGVLYRREHGDRTEGVGRHVAPIVRERPDRAASSRLPALGRTSEQTCTALAPDVASDNASMAVAIAAPSPATTTEIATRSRSGIDANET